MSNIDHKLSSDAVKENNIKRSYAIFREGKQEGKTEVVLKSHKVGLDLETISRITGMAVEEVEAIIKKAAG